ncbi:hypothetical protein [Cupriavidus necator]|uniref:hypothetical protein n=1 Tax=Cupriavidus necator TaxID=106590 RepID=UPI00278B715F|nr:hypothetical protein [Cupriavidus necator]MDQ0142258.1 hypothetical protein [Cupriavidus necator]
MDLLEKRDGHGFRAARDDGEAITTQNSAWPWTPARTFARTHCLARGARQAPATPQLSEYARPAMVARRPSHFGRDVGQRQAPKPVNEIHIAHDLAGIFARGLERGALRSDAVVK